ncbi:MAG TPA: BamA/TamA family outer membrane protein [Opitutaceae bacterium]
MKPRSKIILAMFVALLALFGATPSLISKDKAPTKAKIIVRGLGLLEDRSTRLSLESLWGDRLGATLNSDQIEDATLFITSNLAQTGFQHPVVELNAVLEDGTKKKFVIDPNAELPVPSGLLVRSAHFDVKKGLRSYLANVSINGLHVISEKRAKDLFFSDVALFEGKAARAYSPNRLNRSVDALASDLRQRGYADATVKIIHVQINDHTGAVDVQVEVNEGAQWKLERILTDVRGLDLPELAPLRTRAGVLWSSFRTQDLTEEIRRMYFKKGYADVRIRIELKPAPAVNGVRMLEVIAHIQSGAVVKIGEVKFIGEKRTRLSLLRKRTNLKSGEPLNPIETEQARYRLSRLGVFESVDLKYESENSSVRDPVFDLEEARPLEANLLMGYGSYEKLRGGVEILQKDLWGLAHQSRLELVESFKSSKADYTYTVPEIFGEDVDGSVRLFGLRRQEVAFLREEYGVTLTLKKKLNGLGAEGTLGYTYQSLLNPENDLYTSSIDQRQVTVGSIDVGLTKEARDNPLRPERGYHLFFQAELAAHELGSDVNYQRIEFGGDYHTSWGRGRWIHAGLSHGFVTTLGSGDQNLPPDRRFFPGGDDSIRGYPEGQASPRGPDGRFIGAKSYVLADLEVEQALTKNWTIVGFTDALGVTGKLSSYPFDSEMVSVGLGIRYYTLIGPVRFEYGHNVKRRTGDPIGAFHLSIGFPF